MLTTEENLLFLGKKYLSKDALIIIEICLERNQIWTAQLMMLGVLDRAWLDGKVSNEDAKKDYKLLGMDQRQICEIRQKCADKWLELTTR